MLWAKTIRKKDTTFKKLRAAYAELWLFSKSIMPFPVRTFAIDGESRFYLVTIAELPEFKDRQAEMTQITNAMLDSWSYSVRSIYKMRAYLCYSNNHSNKPGKAIANRRNKANVK